MMLVILLPLKGGDDVDMDMRDPGDMCRTMSQVDQHSWKRRRIGARVFVDCVDHIIIPKLTVR